MTSCSGMSGVGPRVNGAAQFKKRPDDGQASTVWLLVQMAKGELQTPGSGSSEPTVVSCVRWLARERGAVAMAAPLLTRQSHASPSVYDP